MGSGNFNVTAYKEQAQKAKSSENSGFTAKSMCDEFNPSNVNMRFSKKGPFNEFRDVITVLIGLDVTGSMDIIPKSLLEGKLGSLMVDLKETFHKPNENLQISFAGIGDAKSDEAPLQVTHFESDNRFAQQLQKIWLEGHGGGNGAESYNLLWWYAANKTHLNYAKQDGRKGILITIGDDNVHPDLTANEIQMWLDPQYEGKDISNEVLLKAVREQYEVYHIVIMDGDAYKYDYLKKENKKIEQKEEEAKQWTDMLGANNVVYTDSKGVADAIANIVKRHRPLEKENMTNLNEQEWVKKNKENLSDEQWKEVLHYTLCPLTRQFMNYPIEWGNDKKVYEKQAFEDYVQKNQMDPITHKKLNPSELVLKPNLNIAQLCTNYKPFFDDLPQNRKERLIEMVFPTQMSVVHKKNNDTGKKPCEFFVEHSKQVIQENEKTQSEKQLEKMQLALICPISGQIMEDPVNLSTTGQVYDRKGIEEWLENHNTDPNTNVELKDKTLTPNYILKGLCDDAREAQITIHI